MCQGALLWWADQCSHQKCCYHHLKHLSLLVVVRLCSYSHSSACSEYVCLLLYIHCSHCSLGHQTGAKSTVHSYPRILGCPPAQPVSLLGVTQVQEAREKRPLVKCKGHQSWRLCGHSKGVEVHSNGSTTDQLQDMFTLHRDTYVVGVRGATTRGYIRP